jgi:hypothetical protein
MVEVATMVDDGCETITSSKATATGTMAGDEWLNERLLVDSAAHGSTSFSAAAVV